MEERGGGGGVSTGSGHVDATLRPTDLMLDYAEMRPRVLPWSHDSRNSLALNRKHVGRGGIAASRLRAGVGSRRLITLTGTSGHRTRRCND